MADNNWTANNTVVKLIKHVKKIIEVTEMPPPLLLKKILIALKKNAFQMPKSF